MQPPRKLPFKARLEPSERREKIEQAAAELFAARGYEASSLDQIAQAAQVTKRVIYDHFTSKRELHNSLLRKRSEQLLAFVAAAVDGQGTAAERMLAGVEAFFAFVETHPDAWRMLFRDPAPDPRIAAAHRQAQARASQAIAAMMASEPALEAAHDDQWLEMMAEQVKSALDGLAGWWYEHREVPRADIVAAALDFAWRGLDSFTDEP